MKHLTPWLAGWLALFWLWMLLAGEWDRQEWIAAASAATVAATIGEVARERAGAGGHLPAKWLAAAVRIPHMVVADFAILMWALGASLVRRRVVRGAFHSRPFSESVPVRAWAGVLATYSPNAYVVDFDSQHAVLHDLVEWRRSESPVS